MEKIIAPCGNDCSKCPRHSPKSEKELEETAKLWFKIGYRDKIVSTKEISCVGCSIDNWCRYKVINCTTEKNIQSCGECDEYPCDNIKECFKVTSSFIPQCKACCSVEEFKEFTEAFFEKEKNLDSINEEYKKSIK